MTALLLGHYLRAASDADLTLDAIGTRPLIAPPEWDAPAPSGRVHERAVAASGNTDAGLAVRLDVVARAGTAADDAYLDALDRALADLQLSAAEAADLRDVAELYRLDSDRVAELNAYYVHALAGLAGTVDADGLMQALGSG